MVIPATCACLQRCRTQRRALSIVDSHCARTDVDIERWWERAAGAQSTGSLAKRMETFSNCIISWPTAQTHRCRCAHESSGSGSCNCVHSALFPQARSWEAHRCSAATLLSIRAQQLLHHSALQDSGIPVPNHIIVNRDESGRDPPGFEETEDYVSLKGGCLSCSVKHQSLGHIRV